MVLINESPASTASNNGFSQRLREYILKKHGSVNSFCRTTGIKYPAQMTPYLKGKCQPGKKMLERLIKDGADIQWLQSGYSKGDALAPLSNAMALSRYRVEIDNLFRQVRLNSGKGADMHKPEIDAYAVIDHAERFVDLTGSLEEFLGYEKNSLAGAGLASLIHPEDYDSIQSALKPQRPEDDIVSFHSRFKTATGTYINVEWCLYIKSKPMSELHEYAIILRRAGS
jgi:PAS domain S-box-containing protein